MKEYGESLINHSYLHSPTSRVHYKDQQENNDNERNLEIGGIFSILFFVFSFVFVFCSFRVHS